MSATATPKRSQGATSLYLIAAGTLHVSPVNVCCSSFFVKKRDNAKQLSLVETLFISFLNKSNPKPSSLDWLALSLLADGSKASKNLMSSLIYEQPPFISPTSASPFQLWFTCENRGFDGSSCGRCSASLVAWEHEIVTTRNMSLLNISIWFPFDSSLRSPPMKVSVNS